MDMLSVADVVKLMGCDPRTIRRKAQQGVLPCRETRNDHNRPQYCIPINALDPKLQRKYYDQHRKNVQAPAVQARKALDQYTAAEREELVWWTELLTDWQAYRDKPGASKADVDREYATLCRLRYPDKNISIDTLYRKSRALRERDFDGLIDKRGKWRKGKSSINETLWQAYLSFYLDEAQHPIKKCYEYTKMWAQAEQPGLVADMPAYTTFYRRTQQDIPEALEVLGRKGEKAFRDRCAPYIKRTYEDMASNEWWIADNHTFDIISQGENGQRHRLYLTAFFDARSGIFTGCHVTNAPCSQATLIALRKGILKYGIPDNIYVDNGREFLTFDIGGLGHRKKKLKDGAERFEPPPVFARLGIKMTNAIVRNAKAKIIERRFRDIKDQLSRLFETYTGGNVVERPEKLKGVIKNGEIPLDATLIDTVDTLLDWYFNQQPYGGAVSADQGKIRMDVYHEHLYKKRVASPEELSLMLMRSARPQKVTRRGVHLDIAGQRIDYWSDDMLMTLLGKQVYYRYDPDDLSEVRIYDLDDKYIMTVSADNTAVLKYGASKDDVKAAMSKVRRMERITKEALKVSAYPAFGRRTALELVMEAAEESKTAYIAPPEPKVLEMQRATEEPLLRAVGDISLDKMTKNAERRCNKEDYDEEL